MSRNIRSITKRIMKHQIATNQTSQITSCNIPECLLQLQHDQYNVEKSNAPDEISQIT
jgi:hypothetical protein